MKSSSIIATAALGLLIASAVVARDRYPDDFDGAFSNPAPNTTPTVASEPASSPAVSPAKPARPRVRGSLFSEGQFESWTGDRRAFRVGDALTVLVAENASASSSADTGTGRDSAINAGVVAPNWTRSAGITVGNDFNGTGRTQRTGRVLAQITVVVKEVLPSGDLVVAGEQLLEINGEKQTIRAEGQVRPRDVNEQNVVLSNRLANARLAFIGDGVLGDQQRPRWWQKVLALFGI